MSRQCTDVQMVLLPVCSDVLDFMDERIALQALQALQKQ